jgi:hypothetical protein
LYAHVKIIVSDPEMKKNKTLLGLLAVLFCITISARNYFSPVDFLNSTSVTIKCLSDTATIPHGAQFGKFELGISVPHYVNVALSDYFETGVGINPFDPDQVSVTAVFRSGAITDTVYGFYYTDFIRDESTIQRVFRNCPQAKWIEQPTEYSWRVRFAPPTAGEWFVTVIVSTPHISGLPVKSDVFNFTVTEQTRGGFLELGNDRQHFVTSGDRKSFFLLGQDIAWPDGTRFRGAANPEYANMFAGGFMDIQDWITDLAYNGGNTIRVVNVPWSYEFEWDTVGVYQMDRAWELDQLFRSCEENNVKMVFCMEHGTYSLPPWYEEHLTWEKHPYNRFLTGVDHPEDFLRDSTARLHYRNKLRYFLSRWGYSSSLGIFQILSEMDNWTFGQPAGQLEDSKVLQRINLQWHNEMLSYAKGIVKYRPLLTSTSYGDAPRDFSISAYSSPFIDVICPRHCYFTERDDNLRRWYEVNTKSVFEKGVHGLFPKKAAIIDEMGLGSNGGDPGDVDGFTDVVFHNAIWSTAFSGTAGAGLYWWSWSNNSYRAENFPALHRFFADIDFEKYSFTKPGHWEDASRPSNVRIETFYNISADAKQSMCIGWVHNASYWWGNIAQNFKDRNGHTMIINSKTGDDETISAPTELSDGTKFEIHGLAPNTSYLLKWYSTRQVGGEVRTVTVGTNIFGTAKIVWPGKMGDWAYKMERK